jgi:hypothetical protein
MALNMMGLQAAAVARHRRLDDATGANNVVGTSVTARS